MTLSLTATACSGLPFFSSPPPTNQLVYDAPVSIAVKNGSLLPGTSIAYGGKTDTGAGKVLITGLVAPKQLGDAVDWQGTPAPDVAVRLSMRVAAFDDQSITLIGTSHTEIDKMTVQPGGAAGTVLMEFNAPVSLSLNKNDFIPGTNLAYGGSTPDGAQFLGLAGYPYRKALDSLQYLGRVNPKVFLKLDLRVLTFSDSSIVLGGTADVKIES
jgi:hypothetical protein